jgi:hypothetical protein
MAPVDEQTSFPSAGARARRWSRFERDLRAWLATPEGAFATWLACVGLGGAGGAEAPDDDLGVVRGEA